MDFDQKNENIYGSVKSFGLGAIFPPRLGYNLFRNALVGGFVFPERKYDCWKDFGMTSKFSRKRPLVSSK